MNIRVLGAFAATAAVSWAPAQYNLKLTEVASGLSSPVAVIQDPTSTSRQFIVEQGGIIKVWNGSVVLPTPFLNLSAQVVFSGEKGLLGLAFAPSYATSGKFYVTFAAPGDKMQLAEFRRGLDPAVADPGTRRNILATSRPHDNHNAGCLKFGGDGYLYLPTGDGGSGGDPDNRSQNPQDLLGKMLRIDPSRDDFPGDATRNYGIPATNPFVDNLPIVARKEIWAFGLRNPWKFSFDEAKFLGNGALVSGDVGQDSWEEINYEPANRPGNNYGWKRLEGNTFFSNVQFAYGPDTRPAHVYSHSFGQSVTGGYVYRGLELGPFFFGRYFFGDYVSGRLWSCKFWQDSRTGRWLAIDVREHTPELEQTTDMGNIAAIEIDELGELNIVDYQGRITRVSRLGAWPSGLIADDGRIAGGSLRSLILIDGKHVRMAPDTSVPNATSLIVVARSNNSAALGFNMDIVGGLNSDTTALFRVYLKRWGSGQFVQVRAYIMDEVQRRFRITGLESGEYIRAGDGRIEVRMSTELRSPVTTVVSALYDQVLITH